MKQTTISRAGDGPSDKSRGLGDLTKERTNVQTDLLNRITLPSAPVAARRFARGSKGHFVGSLIVGPGAGWAMEVESHLEMQVALVLSIRAEVAELENQVPFQWQPDPEADWNTHFFDFRANMRDGSRTAIMVKPSKKLNCQDFLAKARAIACQVTPKFADHVTVMTERDVDPIDLYNAEFLHGLKETDPEADSAARRATANVVGAFPIRDIVSAVGLEGRGFRAVGRLVRNRELCLTRKERISADALVMRRAA